MRPDRMSGFTLVELMVAIVILAILTTAALPSFRSFIVKQRIKSASFDIMSSMIMARSEAIKRNANVTVTPVGGSWGNGWDINAGGTSVLSQSTLGGGVSTTCYANGAAVAPCPTLTYTSNGRLTGTTAPAIQLNSADTSSPEIRCISIDLSGRPNSKRANCP